MLRFKAKITPNKTATKTAKKKRFLVFSTKSEKIAIQQSHIINPLLTSFAQSVWESIAFGFYRTDLAPSSLGPYENLRQYFPVQTSHSVNKSLIYSNIFCACEMTEQTLELKVPIRVCSTIILSQSKR